MICSLSRRPSVVSISDEKPLHMRRDDWPGWKHVGRVSISDEKPLHMRHKSAPSLVMSVPRFNLRREAAPHATKCGGNLAGGVLYVSISDEKPLHMRPANSIGDGDLELTFQSQTRSRSTCDAGS